MNGGCSRHARTTFTIPQGIFHRSLLLSPHLFLLTLLFRHSAFDEESGLTCPEDIEKLDIHLGENELPLPLRRDLDEVFIFRKAIRTLTGYDISSNEPVTYGTMARWIKAIGEVLGIEYNVICYCLRYLTGNSLDQSRMFNPVLNKPIWLTAPVQLMLAMRFGTCV